MFGAWDREAELPTKTCSNPEESLLRKRRYGASQRSKSRFCTAHSEVGQIEVFSKACGRAE